MTDSQLLAKLTNRLRNQIYYKKNKNTIKEKSKTQYKSIDKNAWNIYYNLKYNSDLNFRKNQIESSKKWSKNNYLQVLKYRKRYLKKNRLAFLLYYQLIQILKREGL